MRRRRRTRASLGVSLFPFLAVLICTLGVLIVLLVLAVRSADVRASREQSDQQEKHEQQTKRLNELNSEYDVRVIQAEGLTNLRPDIVKRMAAAREHRGHIESEIRALKQKAREIAMELMALQQTLPTENETDLSGDKRAKLKRQIQLAQEELKTKRSQVQSNTDVTFSIVPHAGSGGTFRRPIFVECTGDALILQPMGIRLPISEFAPPLGSGNMLDSALLAIREYWQKYDLGGDEGNPYPLLVVRPEGAKSFVLARHAMTSWDDEFGYELVESDKKLDFGIKDDQLTKQVQIAVDDARNRQRSLSAHRSAALGNRLGEGSHDGFGPISHSSGPSRSHPKSSERPGLVVSSSTGGFVSNSGWERPTRPSNGSPDSTAQIGTTQSRKEQSAAGNARSSFENSSHTDSRNASFNSNGGFQSSKSGGPNAAARSGDGDAPASGMPPNPFQNSSLAKTRGANWALPTQSPGATGYVRPIRVVCSSDELEIRSALGTEKTIAINENLADSIDPLINEIWRQIESWGVSGERSFWKPEMRISVVSGGELNFQKLQGLLHDSGVDVKQSN
jgi:hypothetical protein